MIPPRTHFAFWYCPACSHSVTDTEYLAARYNYLCPCGHKHLSDYRLSRALEQ